MNAGCWPSLRDYIAWAQEQGCTVTVETVERERRTLQIVSITTPSGAKALEIAAELDDPLMSTTIARLDRRLGMKSHLFR